MRNPINDLPDYLPNVRGMEPWQWQKELNCTKEQAEYIYSIQKDMEKRGYRWERPL